MHLLINTGGGDAPGLNAVIRAAVLSAHARGWKVTGIRRGYHGLMDGFPDRLITLTPRAVRGITHLGGTILGTVNRGHPFEYPMAQEDGSMALADRSDEVMANIRSIGADGLIAIGGDGSLRIATRLMVEKGLKVIGVPKTIDNDLFSTQVTFGFDTAVTVATEAIDRLHSTAESHNRVMVVELMGRYAGWISLNAGLAGTADVILLPEIPYDIDIVCKKIQSRYKGQNGFAIVVVAEGARPKGGVMSTVGQDLGAEVRLGGAGAQVAAAIQERTGRETRSLVLGHLQRGGGPTTFDRLIALRFGSAAIRMAEADLWGNMVAWQPPKMVPVPLQVATSRMKVVSMEQDTVITARELGVCLGD